MPTQFDPPSGTRDFLAREFETRERAFALIRSVFARYGFEPLATPAFERLDVLMGKYGEEGDKLIFKILRRGEHEGTGEADLALRYDLTVPLARVAAAMAASCRSIQALRHRTGLARGPAGPGPVPRVHPVRPGYPRLHLGAGRRGGHLRGE